MESRVDKLGSLAGRRLRLKVKGLFALFALLVKDILHPKHLSKSTAAGFPPKQE